MFKIAVLGDYDSIYGFATLGLDTFPVTAQENAKDILHQLAGSGYGIIYVTEAVSADLQHEISRYQEQLAPIIIPIPGVSGNTGEGVNKVKRSVERAVGSDIIFSNNN